MTDFSDIKAPFPAFGGKSQVVDLVWERLGDPRNFIEPFTFSAVMTLRRPSIGAIETINDLNAYVSNFWRAIKHAPAEVAEHADWPVNETDLHARHRWLVQSETANTELQRVRDEPEYFNAKIAGWWCWGACCWIGSGWCERPEWEGQSGIGQRNDRGVNMPSALDQKRPIISADGSQYGLGVNGNPHQTRPQLEDSGGRGVLGAAGEVVAEGDDQQLPHMTAGQGVHRQLTQQLPHMDGAGRGCIGNSLRSDEEGEHRPQLADAYSRGRGVNGNDAAGSCEARRRWLMDWFYKLQDRLRPVRVCCGHWARVCDSPSTLTRLGLTGVFLDPPYRHKLTDGTKNRSKHIYVNDKHQDVDALCDEVQDWCLRWGNDREIRIALCGLEGEYPKLEEAGWEVVAWKSRGGYGNRTEEGKANAARERIWFSRHCLRPEETGLFGSTNRGAA